MQILSGDLIRMPDHGRLPIPWYHRAPIGLQNGTEVHVAFLASSPRSVGDILVSVLEPDLWPWTFTVTAYRADAPGVLAEAFQDVPPLNIALAEAATVDCGERHEIRQIVQPYHPDLRRFTPEETAELVREELDRIRDRLEACRFEDVKIKPIPFHRSEIVDVAQGKMHNGWVVLPNWRRTLAAFHMDGLPEEIDTEVAVISADTTRRTVRYVFPRRGARSIHVEHKDRPGAMAEVAKHLSDSHLNVLSLLTRRSTTSVALAEIVAIVEPESGASAETVDTNIASAHKALKKSIRVNQWTVRGPRSPTAFVQSRDPGEIVVRPPDDNLPSIQQERALMGGSRGIFISHRFLSSGSGGEDEILRRVKREITRAGFVPLTAEPEPGATRPSAQAVQAKMWAATAAVMLVVPTDDQRYVSTSMAHEAGFMHGQSKEIFFLVEKDLVYEVGSIPNFQGVQQGLFSRSHFNNSKSDDESIASCLRPWLKKMRQSFEVRS